MSEFIISSRYANALMGMSEEKNSFQSTVTDVVFIKNTLEGSKELRNFLNNPIIKLDDKSNALRKIFSEHLSANTITFLMFLAQKGRINLLFEICNRFIELSNIKLNQIDVVVSSAVELDENQKNEITNKLEDLINKRVMPSFKIDNRIIGGFLAKFNDTVIDASIKHQLEKLKKQLFEENYLKN